MNNKTAEHGDELRLSAEAKRTLNSGNQIKLVALIPAFVCPDNRSLSDQKTLAAVDAYLTQLVMLAVGSGAKYVSQRRVSLTRETLGRHGDYPVASAVLRIRRRSLDALQPAEQSDTDDANTPVGLLTTANYKHHDPRWTEPELAAAKCLLFLEAARKRRVNPANPPIGPSGMVHLPQDTHRRAKLHAASTGTTLSRYVTDLVESDLAKHTPGEPKK